MQAHPLKPNSVIFTYDIDIDLKQLPVAFVRGGSFAESV